MNLNLLCEDVQRTIASFSCGFTAQSLKTTCTLWRDIVNTSKLHVGGSLNGSHFSYFVYEHLSRQNVPEEIFDRDVRLHEERPIYMPYVDYIDMTNIPVHKFLRLFDHLGPQLPSIRSKWTPELNVNQTYLNLNSVTFSRVIANGECVLNLNAESLVCSPKTYLLSSVNQVKSLCMTSYSRSENHPPDLLALQKAFQSNLESLELFGVLTDSNMNALTKKTSTLKTLFLHHQSICTWKDTRCLQINCPNLEEFGISSSSLLDSDLEKFDWTLWPRLHTLIFDQNYILWKYAVWPPALRHLRICYCIPESLPSNLESLAVILQGTCATTFARWEICLKRQNLKKLTLTFSNFLPLFWTPTEPFWTQCEKLDALQVHLREGIFPEYIEALRKRLPNVFVSRH